VKFDKSDKPELPPGPRMARCGREQDGGVRMTRSHDAARGGAEGETHIDPADVELSRGPGMGARVSGVFARCRELFAQPRAASAECWAWWSACLE
jgi:hypothetical protein